MAQTDEFLTEIEIKSIVEQVVQVITDRPIAEANELFEVIHTKFVEIQTERILRANQEMRQAKANLRKL
jgi:hypothetical protein